MPRRLQRTARGFTIVEMIAVIVIAGVLSISVTATFSRRTFDESAVAEQARAWVSYAQKTAIAARRAARVQVAGSAATLQICQVEMSSTEVCPSPGTNFVALAGPTGAASLAAPAGVTLTSSSTFHFDSLGRPVDSSGTLLGVAQTLTITGGAVVTVTIEPETGYVHR
jgi:MSHA pilin protein MshC